ncbi:MAG: protein kinase [Deltaproteobacteria bacterium]|nr:protein kinase [Deltaproteobacteria bacterium]
MQPGSFVGTPRFELLRKLGVGGFGVVYEARDQQTHTRVALKLLHRTTPDGLVAFKQEFNALADVSHPNLVALYELCEHEGHWFYTMELVEGVDIVAYLRPGERVRRELAITIESRGFDPDELDESAGVSHPRSFPVDYERLEGVLSQLAEGVLALHDVGLLHRDLKPTNILVDGNGRVVLLDFGLVSRPDHPDALRALESSPAGTQRWELMAGTPEYMSPEQSLAEPLGPVSDWYSVGIVLFEAIAGRRPFEGTLSEVMSQREFCASPDLGGLAPEAPQQVVSLVMRMLAREPSQRPSDQQIASELGIRPARLSPRVPVAHDELVGRARLLSSLGLALAQCRTGHPVVLELSGPSGMGKTAVMSHFVGSLAPEDALVLATRCDPRRSVPFSALDGCMDALALHLRGRDPLDRAAVMPAGIAPLAQVFPVLSRFVQQDEPSAEVHEAHEERSAAFESARTLLQRLSKRVPLVFLLDDAHWLDEESAALLRYVLQGHDAPRLLILMAARAPSVVSAAPLVLDEVRPEIDMRKLTIEPLDRLQSRELLGRMLSSEARLSSLPEALVDEAAGSPLFIGEIARAAERAPLAELRDLSSLNTLLQAKINGLPPSARHLLALVVVLGEPMPLHVVFAAAGLENLAYPALRLLQNHSLIRTSSTPSGVSIEAYHERIRETVLSMLSPESLVAQHQRLADALSLEPEAEPALLAEHLAGAGLHARAAQFALAAAQRAESVLAFERAAHWLDRAMQWQHFEEAMRVRLLVRRGHALAQAGRNAEASRALLLSAKISSDPTEARRLRRSAAVQLLLNGDHDEGVRIITEIAGTIDLSIPRTRPTLLASLVKDATLLRLGRELPTSTAATRANEDEQLALCHAAGLGTALSDSLLSIWFLTRYTRLALASGDGVQSGLALMRYSTILAARGPRGEGDALDALARAELLALRHRDPYLRGCVDIGYGFVDYTCGRWSQGRLRCERAMGQLRRVAGANWDIDTAGLFVSECLRSQGQLAAAFRLEQQSLREARDRKFASGIVRTLLRWQYFEHLSYDDVASARLAIEEGERTNQSRGFLIRDFNLMVANAHVCLYEGRPAKALALVRSGWWALRTSGILTTQLFRGSALELLGICLLRTAELAPPSEAAVLRRECRKVAQQLLSEPGWVGSLGLALQFALVAQGTNEDLTLACGRRALGSLETADMWFYAALVRKHLGRLLGGDEGGAMVRAAEHFVRGQGVVRMSDFGRLHAGAE